MPPRKRKKKISYFIPAYALLLAIMAVFGYYALRNDASTGTLAGTQVASHGFHTDLAYYDLPRMTVSIGGNNASNGGGGSTAPRVRVDISLEVASKDIRVIDGFQPRITDRLSNFLSQLTPEQIETPSSTTWLREQMLRQINAAGSPVPVHDLMFRQLVIM
jgi:flagellar basal body-associated protein FliL